MQAPRQGRKVCRASFRVFTRTMRAEMNGYKAFYKGRTIDVRAETSLQAQDKAAKQFKARKTYEVTVMLCEKDNMPVIHSTRSI